MSLSEMVANLEEHLGRNLSRDEFDLVWESHRLQREFEESMGRTTILIEADPTPLVTALRQMAGATGEEGA